MVLSIRTNVAQLLSRRNLTRTHSRTTDSLERMSTGLRINKAADDSSGMVIADSLRSQARGLGQAARNATDAISIVQVADAALEESIAILTRIKVKSIQAAQDGQTTESRAAIQSDIRLLIEELDTIAKTTSFNGQKLLSGTFTGKAFQIGAYTGEEIHLSIDPSSSDKIGHLTTANLTLIEQEEGQLYIGIKGGFRAGYTEMPAVDLAFDNTPEHGLGALADAINKSTDATGIRASARVSVTMDAPVRAGTTDKDFSINGVRLGSFSVLVNDADGALVKAVNRQMTAHGVTASLDASGRMTLTAPDGRGIQVDPPPGRQTGIDKIFSSQDLTTFGAIQIQGWGAGAVDLRNLGGGEAVSVTDGRLEIQRNTETTADSILAQGSVLTQGTVLAGPWVSDQALSGDVFDRDILIEERTSLVKDSALGKGSIVLTKSILPDTVAVNSTGRTTNLSLIKEGSVLRAGSILGKGTELPAGNIVSAGTPFKGDALIASTIDTTASSRLRTDSVLAAGTVIASGSIIKGTAVIRSVGPMNSSAFIRTGSLLRGGSVIASGTTLGGNAVVNGLVNTTGTYTLAASSVLEAGTVFSSGTTLGGTAFVNAVNPTTGSYSLAGSSILETGSVLASGTVLTGTATINALGPTTNNFSITNGSTLPAGSAIGSGTVLTDTATVTATGPTTGAYALAAGSTLIAGSVLGGGRP